MKPSAVISYRERNKQINKQINKNMTKRKAGK